MIFFNRKYVPLGWNDDSPAKNIQEERPFAGMPIYTKYTGLSEHAVLNIAKSTDAIRRNDNGDIHMVFF